MYCIGLYMETETSFKSTNPTCRPFILGMLDHLVFLYQVCLNYNTEFNLAQPWVLVP